MLYNIRENENDIGLDNQISTKLTLKKDIVLYSLSLL